MTAHHDVAAGTGGGNRGERYEGRAAGPNGWAATVRRLQSEPQPLRSGMIVASG
jgi:hypothetical protein